MQYLTPPGGRLRTAQWSGPRGTVLLLNGRTEFIEKHLETVAALQSRGFAVLTMDWRGQGGSGRLLADPMRNHITSFQQHLADLDLLVRTYVPAEPRPIMLAHSMGGHLGLRYLATRPGLFARAILTAPMIDMALPPRLTRRTARLLAWTATAIPLLGASFGPGTPRAPSPNRPFANNPLTTCPERFHADLAWLQSHPSLITGGATWSWLRAAADSIAAIHRPGFAEALDLPILMALAGDERLVSSKAAQTFAARLPEGRVLHLPAARHEVLRETRENQALFWAAFDEFVGEPRTWTAPPAGRIVPPC